MRDGVSLGLRGRTVDLLRVLFEHRPRMIASDELLRLAWPRLAVSEAVLDGDIARLRSILGDAAISSGNGRGYRLTIEPDAAADTDPKAGKPGGRAGDQTGLPSANVLPCERGNHLEQSLLQLDVAPDRQGGSSLQLTQGSAGSAQALANGAMSTNNLGIGHERDAQQIYRFDRCEVRPAKRQMLVGGGVVKLGARALDILLLLIEHRDRVVSRAEVFERVWPRSVVVDGNLQVHIFTLRKICGAHTIATVPGRGYRFTAELEANPTPHTPPPAQAAAWGGARPAPRSVLQFKSNLPQALDDLFGREDDLNEVRALVSGHRLVTITGPGGIGKTRLAQRLAVEQRASHRNGVCWVDLSSVTDLTLVPGAIGSDLGLQLAHGDLAVALAQALGDAQVLIVLDNAEHLIAAVAATATVLLEQTQAVRLLVTSQVPLRISREVQFRLGAIAVPDEDDLSPDEALEYGAIQLFAQRAKSVDRHFALGTQTLRAVIDVCRQLDAVPLAIELAAARAGTIGLARLAESLDERLSLLQGGARDAPRRHQTLLATMQWSHALLCPEEMLVFRRLGVFRSGFGLELAQRVAADEPGDGQGRPDRDLTQDPLGEWAALEHLNTLVDHSLVAVDPGDVPRYRLLETARLFALDRLAASGETFAVSKRFAQAILAQFVQQEERIWRGQVAVDDGIAALEPDLANFRRALQWSMDNDAELAVGLASTLEHAVTSGRMDEMLALFDATEPLVPSVGEAVRARWALAYARNLNSERGHKARHWAGCTFDIHVRLGPPERRHLALAAKLMCELAAGDCVDDNDWSALLEGEQRHWSDAVKSVRPRAMALRSYYAGDFPAAISAGRELLQMAERCGSALLVKTTKLDLAEFARSMGRLDESIRVLAELVDAIHPVQERNLAALAWVNLFGCHLAAGNLAQARDAAQRASAHCALAQVQHWWADGAAWLAALEGRPHAAARLIGYADAMYGVRCFARQPNELAFRESAAAASQLHLSAEIFGQLLASGARLSDEAAIGIGLGNVDF